MVDISTHDLRKSNYLSRQCNVYPPGTYISTMNENTSIHLVINDKIVIFYVYITECSMFM